MARGDMTRRTFLSAFALGGTALMLSGCAGGNNEPASSPSAASSTESVSSSTDPSSRDSMEANSEESSSAGSNRTLVVYFSNTGNTESVAEKIADITGGTLFRIEPSEPYTSADLDYNDDSSRCMQELNDPSSRPGIVSAVPDWDSYNVVFLGYPIWWSRTPPIMQTFVENYNWSGKTVVPFCTSGSSSIGSSASVLEQEASGSEWLPGRRFSASATVDELTDWVNSLIN